MNRSRKCCQVPQRSTMFYLTYMVVTHDYLVWSLLASRKFFSNFDIFCSSQHPRFLCSSQRNGPCHRWGRWATWRSPVWRRRVRSARGCGRLRDRLWAWRPVGWSSWACAAGPGKPPGRPATSPPNGSPAPGSPTRGFLAERIAKKTSA